MRVHRHIFRGACKARYFEPAMWNLVLFGAAGGAAAAREELKSTLKAMVAALIGRSNRDARRAYVLLYGNYKDWVN
jgi:hypothetical protein